MNNETLQSYLKMVGMRHTSIMELWADLMNETKGQIAGWLVENKIHDMKQLAQYLRPNQIAALS
jgi:hypothetical protein